MLFTNLLKFVKIYIDIFEVADINQSEMLTEIPVLCIQAIQHTDSSIKLAALQNIPKIFNIWPVNLRKSFYIIFKKILSAPEPNATRQEILSCLNQISDKFIEEIINDIILTNDLVDCYELKYYLDSLKILAPKKQYMEIVFKQIVTECQSGNATNSFIAFSTLYQILDTNRNHHDLFSTLHNKFSIIDTIVNLNQTSNIETLKYQSGICRLVINKLDLTEQCRIVNYLLPLIKSFENPIDDITIKNIFILEGLIVNLRPEVEIVKKFELLKVLMHFSSKVETSVFLYVCHIFANVINKAQEGKIFKFD